MPAESYTFTVLPGSAVPVTCVPLAVLTIGAVGAKLSSLASLTPLLLVSVILDEVSSDSCPSVKPSPSVSSSPSSVPSPSVSAINGFVPVEASSASLTPSPSSSVSALLGMPSSSVSIALSSLIKVTSDTSVAIKASYPASVELGSPVSRT